MKRRKYYQKTVWASGTSGAGFHINSSKYRIVSMKTIGRKKYKPIRKGGRKYQYKYRIIYTER